MKSGGVDGGEVLPLGLDTCERYLYFVLNPAAAMYAPTQWLRTSRGDERGYPRVARFFMKGGWSV